jgi:glycosyltransferase involved in cell wall biosynthesis
VKRVQFVISSLGYSGAARQLTLLAAGLAGASRPVRVCVLGGPAPWGDELRAAGVEVETLGRRRSLDPRWFLALRRSLRSFGADVVHAWDGPSLRAVALVHGLRDVWASAALPPAGNPSWIDAWLLRRVGRVVALGEADAARYRAAGVSAERVAVVRPAVAPSQIEDSGPRIDGNPQSAIRNPQSAVLLGPLLPHKGVREAVWVVDMLHPLHPDLELVLVGDPPPPRDLEALSHVDRVRLVGPRPDVAPYLEWAEVVLAPARAGGVSAALEAMAAGRPVVAARTPALSEVVEDGVTGYLFTPDDKADLGRQLHRLLDDPDRRRAMGEAGRRRAAEHFAPAQLLARYAALLSDSAE